MLNDFTFGQFFPIDSLIHKLDPRTKLLATLLAIILIFVTQNIWALLFVAVAVFAIIFISKIPFKMYLKNIKFILPIILLTTVINLFYIKDGNLILNFWIIKITDYGIYRSVFMGVRVILLILISAVLTYTTSPNDITDGLERLFSPLRFIGLGKAVHTITMMMTIALRFIPTLIEETDKIISAQKSRGADFESGNLLSRAKALMPILIPLFISAIKRANELATAMESRCYHNGIGRTRMKKLKSSKRDYIASLVMLLILGAVIAFQILTKSVI